MIIIQKTKGTKHSRSTIVTINDRLWRQYHWFCNVSLNTSFTCQQRHVAALVKNPANKLCSAPFGPAVSTSFALSTFQTYTFAITKSTAKLLFHLGSERHHKAVAQRVKPTPRTAADCLVVHSQPFREQGSSPEMWTAKRAQNSAAWYSHLCPHHILSYKWQSKKKKKFKIKNSNKNMISNNIFL